MDLNIGQQAQAGESIVLIEENRPSEITGCEAKKLYETEENEVSKIFESLIAEVRSLYETQQSLAKISSHLKIQKLVPNSKSYETRLAAKQNSYLLECLKAESYYKKDLLYLGNLIKKNSTEDINSEASISLFKIELKKREKLKEKLQKKINKMLSKCEDFNEHQYIKMEQTLQDMANKTKTVAELSSPNINEVPEPMNENRLLKTKVLELEEELRCLKQDIENVREECYTKYKIEMDDLIENMKNSNINDTLNKELQGKNLELQSLLEKKKESDGKLLQYEQQLLNFESEKTKLVNEIEFLMEGLTQAKQESQLNMNKYIEIKKLKKKETDDFVLEVKTAKEREKNYEHQIVHLESKLKGPSKKEKEIVQFENECLKTELNESKQRGKMLSKDLISKSDDVCKMRKMVDEKVKELEIRSNEITQLQHRLESKRIELIRLDRKCKKTEADLEEANQRAEKERYIHKNLSGLLIDTKNTFMELRKRYDEATETNECLEKKLQRIQQELQDAHQAVLVVEKQRSLTMTELDQCKLECAKTAELNKKHGASWFRS